MIDNLIRYVINFVLSGILVLLFRGFSWITFVQPPKFVSDPTLNDLLVAIIIAFVIFFVGEVLGFIYKIIRTLAFLFGCVVTFIYFFISGYLKLSIASLVLANWFTYTTELIPVILISLLIGFVRWPHSDEVKEKPKKQKSKSGK